jgi:hypothetical protein
MIVRAKKRKVVLVVHTGTDDLEKIPKKEFKVLACFVFCFAFLKLIRKRQYAINRLAVLKLFYRFCQETNPLSKKNSFKAWLAERK